MSRNAKQRTTLNNLNEPQQMRELNRQLTWIWDQLLGGLSLKSLNAGTRKVIDSKASAEEVDELGNMVSSHSTAIVQTAEQIELTAGKMETLGDRIEQAESSIRQTPDEIRAAVESVQIGGRNLLRSTKALDGEWERGAAHSRTEGSDGFSQIDWKVTGLTADAQSVLKSPLFRLPDGWLGRKAVLSFWVKAEDWETLDAGMEANICLTTGDMSDSYRWARLRMLDAGGAPGTDMKGDAPENGKWKRIWATAELTQEGLEGGTVEAAAMARDASVPIVITVQPQDQTAPLNARVQYTVVAEGEGLTYQWQYSSDNGSAWQNSPLTGSTTDTLTVPVTEGRNGMLYRCAISDANGNRVYSNSAKLTVGEPEEELIKITGQPADQEAVIGAKVRYTVTAEGEGLTYQWQYSSNGTSWSNSPLEGSQTATLTVPVTASRNGYIYRCRITNADGYTVYSGGAKLTVIRNPLSEVTHGWVGWYVARNADFSMKAPQLEFGDVPSDWSPAPEDAEGEQTELAAELLVQAGAISANAQKIETVNQSAANAQNAADAAQTQANTNKNNLSGVTTRVTTAEANISALDGQVQTKVSQTEFKTELNGLKKTVSDNHAEFTQTATSINQRVTDEVAGLQAQIDVNAEGILLQAGRTVGGTNYLRDSARMVNSAGYPMVTYEFSDELKPKHGERMTVRIWGKLGDGKTSFNVYNTNGMVPVCQLTDNGDGTYSATAPWNIAGDLTYENQVGLRVYAMPQSVYAYSEIYQIKLERGDYATDWSPHPQDPAGSVNAGGVVRVDQSGVHMTGGTIEMETSDGDEYIRIRSDGISASSLAAPDVAPRYDGPSVLYVNPSATSAQIAAGNYFRSLADALAKLNRRWVAYDVAINLAAGMTEYGTPGLAGVSGGGKITIRGNSSNRAKLVGGLVLDHNASRIVIMYLNVDMTGTAGILSQGDADVYIQYCTIAGTGAGGSRGIHSIYGACVLADHCEIYDCERSLYGEVGGVINGYACKGNCLVGANRSTLYLVGTMPCDSTTWTASTWAGQVLPGDVSVDQGSKPTIEPAPVTTAFNYLHSDSYRGGWGYFADEDIRQGYDGGTIYGVIWFDAAAIQSALNGKTVKQASLRLQMADGVGRGVAVSVQLYGTNKAYDGRSGAPDITGFSYGTIGTTEPGEINEITIPVAAVNDIAANRIQALVLKSDDTETYKDRFYSRNYAKFAGSTTAKEGSAMDTAICPRLTVVYQ